MLTAEENDRLCRVEGDAPMGAMLARYWYPVLLSSELIAGGAPVRVRLLGEPLVAYRDPDGEVGVVGEHCPHRGASLVLGRNEPGGLRCLYHGWKVGADGDVLDAPTMPPGYRCPPQRACPVRETAGVVWVYPGPADHQPPFPSFEWTGLPTAHMIHIKAFLKCNWVQALEGVIDSAHSNFLHSDAVKPTGAQDKESHGGGVSGVLAYRPSEDKRPRIFTEDAAYGFRYAAVRSAVGGDGQYVRTTIFAAPCFALIPGPSGWGFFQAFVPVDDEKTLFFFLKYQFDAPIPEENRAEHLRRSGFYLGGDLDATFHNRRTAANLWLQDRPRMAAGSWSGIAGVQNEDTAVQESMGPLYDRRKEHLGPTDLAVIRMRRLMLDGLRSFEAGAPPVGLAEPVPYTLLHAEERVLEIGASWQSVGGVPVG